MMRDHIDIAMRRPHKLTLLPRNALVKTGPVDHAEHNYRPVLGFIQKIRFLLIAKLLHPRRKVMRLLELGSGSGVFLPELSKHCTELYGIDLHKYQGAVAEQLRRHGVEAILITGSAEAIPLVSHAFDRVIAVSVLEFIEDLDAACREIARILSSDGEFVAILPGHSFLLDMGYKILTGGVKCCGGGEDRRDRTARILQRYFEAREIYEFPPYAPRWMRLYSALRLVPARQGHGGGAVPHTTAGAQER